MTKKYFQRGSVVLLDEDVDGEADIGNLIRTSRGSNQSYPQHNSDYRRSNDFPEDGYGELDFA
ncbi:hypothetical protein [Bradyrhizobium erythrophlei]|jgi:hypothetical protein|uniref:Uncharacterized protein n=1 Tax=Bradyrhizobium erythrophlei TaxID=1437360 RepID=A0A1M5PQV9_9BRAD|nr:hypothetical protein [Bradyrhizobium erythrophlei]SHH04006.1 hypothetical protein SAMN05443248_3467 [Bradyrhizobium erythrophlei]